MYKEYDEVRTLVDKDQPKGTNGVIVGIYDF